MTDLVHYVHRRSGRPTVCLACIPRLITQHKLLQLMPWILSLHDNILGPVNLHHRAFTLLQEAVIQIGDDDVVHQPRDLICTAVVANELVLVGPYLHRCATQGVQDVAQHLPRCATHHTVCGKAWSAGWRDCKGRVCVLPDWTQSGVAGVPAWGPGPLHAPQSRAVT